MQFNFLGLLGIVFISEENTSKHTDQKKKIFSCKGSHRQFTPA